MVDTRSSNSGIPLRLKRIFPSWGRRRSAISRSAIIFNRDTIAGAMAFGTWMYSWQTPSVRNRMVVLRLMADGSTWISEALLRNAVTRTWSTNLTTWLEDSSRPVWSSSVSSSSSKEISGIISSRFSNAFSVSFSTFGSKKWLIKLSISSLNPTAKLIFWLGIRALIWSVLRRSLGSSTKISTPFLLHFNGTQT